jgi:[acyl-carrier-protein] S-malonyltransferase
MAQKNRQHPMMCLKRMRLQSNFKREERTMPAFLFPGQGSQKVGTAKSFYEASPRARSLFDHVLPLLPESVVSVLLEGDQESLNDTRNAQPVLLCVEVAIAAHLESLDVHPEVCAGHSLGEIAALTVAGAICIEEAIPFVLERARLMSEDVAEGGMAAVIGMAPEEIEGLLQAGTQIANYNGPSQTIISGSAASLAASTNALKEKGKCRVMPLQVSGPFHSQFMKPAAEALQKHLASMGIASPRVPVLSSVSGAYEDDPERILVLLAQQLCAPVQWTSVMAQLNGCRAVEVGPGTALAGLAKRATLAPDVLPANTPAACESLRDTL